MRGKGFCTGVVQSWCRITPAYAGKRFYLRVTKYRWKDHPRLCGEKQVAIDNKTFAIRITPAYAGKSFTDPPLALAGQGSPPPMRGKVDFAYGRIEGGRITPAYAGKSDAYDNLLNYT